MLTDADRGVRFGTAEEFAGHIDDSSSVIDVALAMAKAWPEGLDMAGEVLAASRREPDDPQIWATMAFLSSRLPEADQDAAAWTSLVRNRHGIASASRGAASRLKAANADEDARPRQSSLFGAPKRGAR